MSNHNYEELKQSVEADYPPAWMPGTEGDHPKTLVGEIIAQREVTTRAWETKRRCSRYETLRTSCGRFGPRVSSSLKSWQG